MLCLCLFLGQWLNHAIETSEHKITPFVEFQSQLMFQQGKKFRSWEDVFSKLEEDEDTGNGQDNTLLTESEDSDDESFEARTVCCTYVLICR